MLDRSQRVFPHDVIILGYCLLMVVFILIAGRPLSSYYDEIIFYSGMAGLTALIIRYLKFDGGFWSRFFRLLYPLLLFTFFYRMNQGTIFILFDNYFDWQLTTFEKMIIGVNPTIYIDRHLLNVWLNEIFMFFYFSYYFLLPLFMLPVFLRKDYKILLQTMSATLITFYLSYILFFLYPVEGPRYHFAGEYINDVEGPVFRQLVNYVIDSGAIHGGCMPSSHVGVAVVIMMCAFKYYGKIGWLIFVIVALGLCG